MTAATPPLVAALGWLPTAGPRGQPQLALPTDLYMVTLHCGEDARGGAAPGMELAVTLLRTRPERFRSRSAGTLVFALLTPAGLLAFLRAPLEGLADRRLPLAAFCSADELRRLRDALLASPDPALRMQLFAGWIERRVAQRHRYGVAQQRLAEAAALIQDLQGPLDLAGVRRELRVSPRQLERDFRAWLGVSPATYARTVRFQRAAWLLAGGGALADTAAALAFADQPHLTRTIRQLSSLTPRAFARAAASCRAPGSRLLAGRVIVVDAD